MPYNLSHTLVNQAPPMRIDTASGRSAVVRCDGTGTFRMRYPGQLRVAASAGYVLGHFVERRGPNNTHPDGTPKGRWQSVTRPLALIVTIRTPDGRDFTGTQVTGADLARFRDLRGVTQGDWSYSVSGQSPPLSMAVGENSVSLGKASFALVVHETVPSKSAPSLLSGHVAGRNAQSFSFDLFRVGQFVASVAAAIALPPRAWQGVVRLKDPAGIVVASCNGPRLVYAVTLATLARSRGPGGSVQLWTLELVGNGADTLAHRVSAQVTATARIHTSVLQQRIETLIGPNGSKLQLWAESREKQVQVRLKILDELSAETLDMHGLLDSVLRNNPQDSGVDTVHPDIQARVAYTLATTKADLGNGLRLASSSVKVKSVAISLGASQRLQPTMPALRLVLQTEGDIVVRVGGFSLATVTLRNNQLELEAGLKLDAQGVVVPDVWVTDSLLDADVHWIAALAAGILSAGLLFLGAAGVTEIVEHEVNEIVRDSIRSAVLGAVTQIPQMLALLLGDDFTYTGVRLEGDDLAFDYIAPLEPDPRPSAIYRGVIGRSVMQLGPDVWKMMPPTMGNTWAAGNLAKVDHVVVVMMENRSFDHVLGYRAQAPGAAGGDGLTPELLQALAVAGYILPALGQSNLAVKTQFPLGVGHELADVAEQLSQRMTGPDGRQINSPAGFMSNFKKHHDEASLALQARVRPYDVLGWYSGADLPFYQYLAQNYAWCDQYHCSHAGPTLPNRMFSLTGDVQRDRSGEAIVDNNDGDNFYLSRAPTIFDLFTRKGLDWRVYESYPSVTMLRMFARYAADNTHIVPISRLAQDVAAGNLPPLTVIEPAMHHFPQSDDHPVADMRNGQAFLKGVYDALRSNSDLWRKTLLIITYDEHGGFYDHVVPPLADLRDARQLGTVSSGAGTPAVAAADDPATRDCLTPYGVRVPTFVVSPWVTPGKGPGMVLDHCSILKTAIARFLGPEAFFLSDRVAASRSFDAFLNQAEPRMDVGGAPPVTTVQKGMKIKDRAIATQPVSRASMRRGNVDYHDLTGRLARMLGR